ncbi:sigma-70 family RNA polymerase sigma factor [Streptomyces cucumeris]|uniref:sigma-70 family RNA polymerase sigma factor n=1 Tax=Streptomyces cucumeris TaxID=2962890 RepID=UPI0020C85006|nr:sigma-70 family RNA polymerase sigma factor [Streptomyces sp. NEAU-Y11]MCP9206714.1 sigma-70 family RNA polymerase sigma factor [Streptomyces sp. NEAU-Y11]
MSAKPDRIPLHDLPDTELTESVRTGEGDEAALTELYHRHRPAVRAFARTCCRDAHTADDLTSEAFARTIDAVRRGRGPDATWRPYLLSVVRRTAIDWAKSARRADLTHDIEEWADHLAPADSGEQVALRREDDDLVIESFRSLSTRWQMVLWHTVVEREPATRVGARLGISASGVGSLAERAREALREAYLAEHAHSDRTTDECRSYSKLLAAAVRRTGRLQNKHIERHVAGCEHCRRALGALTDLNSRLRAVLPGAILLWAGPGYLSAGQSATADAASPALSVPTPQDGSSAGVGAPHAGGGKVSLCLGAATTAAVVVAIGAYLLTPPGEQAEPPRATRPTAALPTQQDTTRALPPPTATEGPGKRNRGSGARPTFVPRAPSTPHPARSAASRRDSATTSPVPVLTGPTRLRVVANGDCMEIPGDTSVTGVEPIATDCDGSAKQSWVVVPAPTGRFVLLRNASTRKCLRNSGTREDRAPVQQQICDARDGRQLWRVVHTREQNTAGKDTAGKDTVAFVDSSGLMALGLNNHEQATQGPAYGAVIGTSHRASGSPALRFRHDRTTDGR